MPTKASRADRSPLPIMKAHRRAPLCARRHLLRLAPLQLVLTPSAPHGRAHADRPAWPAAMTYPFPKGFAP